MGAGDHSNIGLLACEEDEGSEVERRKEKGERRKAVVKSFRVLEYGTYLVMAEKYGEVFSLNMNSLLFSRSENSSSRCGNEGTNHKAHTRAFQIFGFRTHAVSLGAKLLRLITPTVR